jgi:hypothetical protein
MIGGEGYLASFHMLELDIGFHPTASSMATKGMLE